MHHVTADATVLTFLAVVLVTLERPGLATVAGGIAVLLVLR